MRCLEPSSTAKPCQSSEHLWAGYWISAWASSESCLARDDRDVKRYKLVTALLLAVIVVLLRGWFTDVASPNYPQGRFTTEFVFFWVPVCAVACVVLIILGCRKPKESDSRSAAGREESSPGNANLPSGRSALLLGSLGLLVLAAVIAYIMRPTQ